MPSAASKTALVGSTKGGFGAGSMVTRLLLVQARRTEIRRGSEPWEQSAQLGFFLAHDAPPCISIPKAGELGAAKG